jgi:dinuclear metal center YbgI/SA1388 family protein
MPQVKEIAQFLERIAPLPLQEGYDNSGLLVGEPDGEVQHVLVSLDMTEAVVAEAVDRGAQMIVAHHPVIFKALRSLTGKNAVERTVMAALRAGVALYAIHTNLDNVAHGVNAMMGRKLGLEAVKVLRPVKGHLRRVSVYVPEAEVETVCEAAWAAGAGRIGNYDRCSFRMSGEGTFRAGASARPFVGEVGEIERAAEQRVEFAVESWAVSSVMASIFGAHPYEEVAHEIVEMQNAHPSAGAGGIGLLKRPMEWADFTAHVKQAFGAKLIRHTKPARSAVQKIAFCGGTGSCLLPDAIAAGADIFLSSDFKYHEFFDAEDRITIVDIGHAEAEGGICDWLVGQLVEMKDGFPTFAVSLSTGSTNPIYIA